MRLEIVKTCPRPRALPAAGVIAGQAPGEERRETAPAGRHGRGLHTLPSVPRGPAVSGRPFPTVRSPS
jgi:hypothetical protein